jgi:hypothetical protein
MIRALYRKSEHTLALVIISTGAFTAVIAVLTLTIIACHALD